MCAPVLPERDSRGYLHASQHVLPPVGGTGAYAGMPVQTATETEAVYLFNADTGKTILSQNADQQKYVASLTKLMTALLLVESGKDLNGEVTVPTDLTQEFKDIQNANGTTMGLRIGETVRRIDLLNAMLIVSANDAASVIAWDVGGSVVGFVQQMNARAAELGCTGTNFTCAHGLFDYGNVSTAQDLAKIAAACAENQTFAQVAGTASYVLPATNLRKAEHTISSSNSLMNSESSNYRAYVQWVKGGFTTLAGRCIVAFAEKDGHTYGLFAVNARANADLCCAGIRHGQHRFGHRSKIAAAILRYGYGKHVSVLPFCFYASIVYLLLRRKSTKFV